MAGNLGSPASSRAFRDPGVSGPHGGRSTGFLTRLGSNLPPPRSWSEGPPCMSGHVSTFLAMKRELTPPLLQGEPLLPCAYRVCGGRWTYSPCLAKGPWASTLGVLGISKLLEKHLLTRLPGIGSASPQEDLRRSPTLRPPLLSPRQPAPATPTPKRERKRPLRVSLPKPWFPVEPGCSTSSN